MAILNPQQTLDRNIDACKILMARLSDAIEEKAAVESPTYGDAGDARDIAEQLAALIRRAEGVDVGDDYGVEILKRLGL